MGLTIDFDPVEDRRQISSLSRLSQFLTVNPWNVKSFRCKRKPGISFNQALTFFVGLAILTLTTVSGEDAVENEMVRVHHRVRRLVGGSWTANRDQFSSSCIISRAPHGPLDIVCGCEILGEYWVLTSIQCVQLEDVIEGDLLVDVNGPRIEGKGEGDGTSKIFQMIPHPKYELIKYSPVHDLLLLRTEKNILEKTSRKAATLANKYTDISEPLVFFGNGQTDDFGAAKRNAPGMQYQYAYLPIIPKQNCSRLYAGVRTLVPEQICTGHEDIRGGVGPCGTDAGSGLYKMKVEEKTEGDEKPKITVGIVSMSHPEKCSRGITVYTEIRHYLKWLQRYVPDLKIDDIPVTTTTTPAPQTSTVPIVSTTPAKLSEGE